MLTILDNAKKQTKSPVITNYISSLEVSLQSFVQRNTSAVVEPDAILISNNDMSDILSTTRKQYGDEVFLEYMTSVLDTCALFSYVAKSNVS